MKHLLYSLLALAALSLLHACKKEKEQAVPAELTPYKLETPAGFSPMIIPADNPMTEEGVALGRLLFYDPILSGDNTQACADCHRQNFAFTDSTLKFSIGIDKNPGNRNAMPLFNLGWAKQFFWDGGAADLESQVVGPITNPLEMHEDLNNAIAELNAHPQYPAMFEKVFKRGPITTSMVMKAVAQFERTLISADSRYDRYVAGTGTLTPQELHGRDLFVDIDKGDCNHCHVLGGNFTDFDYKNTGLDSVAADEGRARITLKLADKGKFKTPSLRNVALTAPYMHDGRFSTLEECVQHYNKGFRYPDNLDANIALSVKGRLSQQEVLDIVAFLNTLTDEAFIKNPKFKKP